MNIKVQNRQRETFMVHGVSDEAFRTPQKGLIKQTTVIQLLPVLYCVTQGPFTSRITKNQNRNNTTWNLYSFEHQLDNPSTETKHRKVFSNKDKMILATSPQVHQEQGRKWSNSINYIIPCRKVLLFLDSLQSNFP